MNSRSQDELDHLPSISLSPDDMQDRNQERSRKPVGKSSASKGQAPRRFSLLNLLLLVAVLALAAGGYLQSQALEREITEARSQLQETVNRLSEVSGTVSETGASLNKSDSKVRDELKAVNFEIRKLWDLANKRNRPNIEAQGKRLSSLSKELNSDLDKNRASLSEVSKTLTLMQKEMRAVSADMVAGAAINSEQMQGLESRLTELADKVQGAVKQGQRLNGELDSRLKSYDDRIKAIDTHRQQLNRRLLQLETSIRKLSTGKRSTGLEVVPQG